MQIRVAVVVSAGQRRPPSANVNLVAVYAYKRVGGGLASSEAIQLMKIGTS